jgi:3-deoxy-D-manno-octulosonate 8-phosphate phosphatase (KDO 8-P phosphatase)
MNLLDLFSKIKLLIFDLDGVLTNGKLLIQADGEWLRELNIKDGYAIRLAQQKGFTISIVSGSGSLPVQQRLNSLGVEYVYQYVENKFLQVNTLIEELKLKKEEVLFMGDDLPDLPAFEAVGLSTCPCDAADEVLVKALYVSPRKGGEGCVRDVIEKVLKSQGLWIAQNPPSSL